MAKRISIWGATGSIGRQTLEVISRYRERFDLVALTAHSNVRLLLEQTERFRPQVVVVTGDADLKEWENRFTKAGAEILKGREGLLEVAGAGSEDLIVNALVGSVGLEATMAAVRARVPVALANKEVLVMAGETVMSEAAKREVPITPIDSEHSALFQCLQGEEVGRVRRIILTASGGPFWNKSRAELANVSVEDALAHPNWSMGKKVTIDSATLMNKGLEVIEARWLFGVSPDKVDVVIHPQSIVHSMVEFVDGSMKAQLGVPDMRIPISYALTHPDRWPGDYGWMDFSRLHELSFHPPDLDAFPCFRLAYEALKTGGTAPAVMNAADEMAVEWFLSGRIGFLRIAEIIEEVLQRASVGVAAGLDDILEADRRAREIMEKRILPNL